MALQPYLKITSFSGVSSENFDEFEQLLRAGITVGNIVEANRPAFLKLNLTGGALRYFTSLPEATRNDLDNALTALRDRYNQTANSEFHQIRFTKRKFDSTKESAEDYIVDLQKLAQKAFPNIPATAAALEVDRAGERTRRVREAFIQGMPIKYKKKLLKEPPERTVDELGRIVTRELWIQKAYPEEAYPGAFQQLSYDEDNYFSMATVSKKLDEISDKLERKPSNDGQRFQENRSRDSYQPRGSFQRRGSFPSSQGRGRSYQGYNAYPRAQSPHPNRDFCRRCGKFGHMQSRCWSAPQQRNIGQQLPFDRYPKN